MRTLRLVRLAAEAEGVRLREQARRTLVRAMLGMVALGFLATALVFAHVAVWYWLRQYWTETDTALVIAAADLVIAALLAVLAARLIARADWNAKPWRCAGRRGTLRPVRSRSRRWWCSCCAGW